MESKNNRQNTLDDIVFDHRNKAYGAFVIRKRYANHMVRAVLIAIGLIVLFFLISAFKGGKDDDKNDEIAKVISISDLAPPPPIEKAPPPPPPEFKLPPPPKKTIEFVAPEITEERVPEEEQMPTMEEIEEAPVISTETIDLPSPGNVIFEEPPAEIGEGTAKPEIFRFVEEMPEFPGGKEALYKWLGNNIDYPAYAKTLGIEGTVYVSFVVGTDGKIRNVKILRGVGPKIDEEVLRVMSVMPEWKVGKQNGRPVNVLYNLPVYFKLN